MVFYVHRLLALNKPYGFCGVKHHVYLLASTETVRLIRDGVVDRPESVETIDWAKHSSRMACFLENINC